MNGRLRSGGAPISAVHPSPSGSMTWRPIGRPSSGHFFYLIFVRNKIGPNHINILFVRLFLFYIPRALVRTQRFRLFFSNAEITNKNKKKRLTKL
jgi:hypothetical protein